MKFITAIVLSLSLLLTACSEQGIQPTTSSPVPIVDDLAVEQLDKDHDATEEVTTEQTITEDPSILDDELEQEQPTEVQSPSMQTEPDEYDYVLEFPSDSYPETAMHIFSAIENGHSDVCTIDRDGADERRKQSLKGISTKDGYDRDEWPMAMCAEGGEGASVAYINASDNRGAGSWVGHQLSAYDDGEKILFIVSKPSNLFGKPNPNDKKEDLKLDEDLQSDTDAIVYKNCTEAHEAGVTPLFEGDPGYSKKLDRDGDGVACEL